MKVCFIISILCIVIVFCEEIQPAENRLHHELLLLRSYNNLSRPTSNDSVQLTVKLGIRLSQLLDMDEKNQIMTTSVWIHQEWYDLRLQWDPKEYDGINMTHIPSKMLWRPDIVLYNNADGDFTVTHMTKATVHYDGKIIWEPPVIYKSYCPIDVEYFPFDMQECFLKFSSWTYDIQEIDLQHICAAHAIPIDKTTTFIDNGIDIKDYIPNVEWDIINVTAVREVKKYPCCEIAYPILRFYVTVRRRTLFYSLNLIMPCVSISCLTVLVFYLPSDSGEKITLSISILLALTVFFLLLSDINPPTSLVIPLIGKYLLFTMIVVTMSIFLAVYTLGINFRSPATHRMSPWVRRVFTEILPGILFMKRPEINCNLPKKIQIRTCNRMELRDPGSKVSTWGLQANYDNIETRPSGAMKTYSNEMKEAFKEVITIAQRIRHTNKEKAEVRDWKFIAMVMDRLFLYIFTSACICGTLSIYLYAPSLYDSRPPLTPGLSSIGNCTY